MTITNQQLKELREAQSFGTKKEFNELLEKYTGVIAKSYIGFSYYDEFGNYLGDSNTCTIHDILRNIPCKVVD